MVRHVKPDFFHRKAYQVFWGENTIYYGSITLLLVLAQLFSEEDEELDGYCERKKV